MNASGPRFQESAEPLPAPARLFTWGARALYLGPALNLSAHRNAVAVLALGLDARFGVSEEAGDPAARYRSCRSVLIPPDTLHHFRDTKGRMAFLYVDALSRDLARLTESAARVTARAGFDLDIEHRLIRLLRDLAGGRTDWPGTRAALAPLLGASAPADPRITKSLGLLHEDFGARIPLADLARAAGLSEGRFRHLFVAATGLPVRRYRLWIAMGSAMRAVARGETLTTAAHAAGFSSSAHFSSSFRGMFGMEPSRLSGGRLAALNTAAFARAKP